MRSSRFRPIESARTNSLRRRPPSDPMRFVHYAVVARSRSFDGGFDDLPLSIQRALQVDRSFYTHAACRTERGTPKIAWVASSGRKYQVGANYYSGDKLIELALTVCSTCPVQWQCANAALEADERAGIWADTLDNLHWLRRQGNHQEKLEMAESAGVTVQRTIVILRTHLT